jgi:hypothetical protein
MTTQLPQQPPSAYPTAPPWATPAPAEEPPPQPPGAVTPWGAPYLQTGQLLVPYPEEMRNASRPAPPSWWPVLVWTFFLGIFGVVSAARRANRARRGGNTTAPYWIAWGVMMAVVVFLSGVGRLVIAPAVNDYLEKGYTTQVEKQMRTDGALKKTLRVSATAVNCDPVGPRDDSGVRAYDCALTLEDGRTGTLAVTADTDGTWTVVPTKR